MSTASLSSFIKVLCAMPQLVFVHVPKTAGMSLLSGLIAAYGAEAVLSIRNEADIGRWRRMNAAERRRYAVVCGHLSWPDLESRIDVDAVLVSILRDPIARCLSGYNYMCSWDRHPRHETVRKQSFRDYVVANEAALRSRMCRQLTGEDTAANAIERLPRYALIGTTNQFPNFVDRLVRLTGRAIATPRANATTGQGWINLDSQLCETLLAITAEDRKLYQHVTALNEPALTR